MTNAELIQAIRNEIERRKKALHSTLFNDEYNDLLSFLSTLEKSEKPIIPNDLEEAAKEYEDALGYYECMSQWPSFAFIAGAKWQKLKDEERK